jgi:hypothetical protein
MATIEIPNGDKVFPIGKNEPVKFIFKQDAFFQTGDGDSFTPPLTVGKITAGTTAIHHPSPGSEGSNVLYCYALDGATVATCKNPITNPTNQAGHIIHIGSGGSAITRKEIAAFEAALEVVTREDAFVDLWPTVKSFLNLLLKAKPPIPSRFRIIIQILVMTGEGRFLLLRKGK